jgi:hypothetical protein
MAKKATLTPEPEISAPPPVDPPRPPRPDPGVIEGEATEIRDESAEPPPAPEAGSAPGAPWPWIGDFSLSAPPTAAIYAGLGALIGAIIALFAAWLIDPRAAALDRSRASVAALEQSAKAQSVAVAALDQRVAGLETGASGLAKADALDALAGRVGALETAKAGDVAKSALDAAQAAKADAAKALDLAERAPPPAATNAGPDASALASRLDSLDQRLARLEGASSAAKSEDRLTPTVGAATGDPIVVALLALSLDERFVAGAPFAPELAALAKQGVGAEALAALKSFADTGAPTAATIEVGWTGVEPQVAAAAAPPEASGWDRLYDHVRALVRIRRVGAAAGSGDLDVDSDVAAIGAALAARDVAGALAAFAKLPEAARAAGADWARGAAARQGAASAVAALRADALGALAAGKD